MNRMPHETVTIAPEIFLFGSLALLLLPLPWLVAWAVAIALHELAHIGAIRLCGGKILHFQLGFGGAVLRIGGLSYGREALCSLAGPLCGLALLLTAHWFPRLAICGLIQSVYNLLPVFPLDGGRAVRCLLVQFLPLDGAVRCSRAASFGVIACLLGLAAYGAVRLGIGLLPFLLPLVLFARVVREA